MVENQEAFLAMIPGAIGNIRYKWEDSRKVLSNSEQQDKNSFIDQYAGEYMHSIVSKSMYGEKHVPIENAFILAREEARKEWERLELGKITLRQEMLQVGDAESLKRVMKLKNHPYFKGWKEPHVIQAFITETTKILNEESKKN